MSDRWLYAWALGSLSFGAASLLVPVYIVQLGATPVQLGVLAATAALVGAPGALLYGRLANNVGRHRFLVLSSLGIVTIVLAIFPLLDTIAWIIVVNACLWFVIASVGPVLTMVMVDTFPESVWGQRLGQFNKFQGWGWAAGLVLGAAWPSVGGFVGGPVAMTRSLFWILTGGAGVSMIWAIRTLPGSQKRSPETDRQTARRITRLLSETKKGIKGSTFSFTPTRLYWATRGTNLNRVRANLDSPLSIYLVAVFLAFGGFAAFWAPLPLILIDEGFGASQIFGLYVASSLASAALYARVGSLDSRFDDVALFATGLTLRGLLFPLTASVLVLGASTIGFGIAGLILAAIGITWAVIAVIGTSIITKLAPVHVRGDILGVHVALVAVAGGFGSFLGGWLASLSPLIAIVLPGTFVLLAASLVLSLREFDDTTEFVRP